MNSCLPKIPNWLPPSGRDGEMIEQIRRSNDKIEGEEISAKMDQMETIAKKIFEQVQEHPESCRISAG